MWNAMLHSSHSSCMWASCFPPHTQQEQKRHSASGSALQCLHSGPVFPGIRADYLQGRGLFVVGFFFGIRSLPSRTFKLSVCGRQGAGARLLHLVDFIQKLDLTVPDDITGTPGGDGNTGE